MPVDFCRHLVGKTFEKCLSLIVGKWVIIWTFS